MSHRLKRIQAPGRGSAERQDFSSSPFDPSTRPTGACVHCKTLKIRCEFIPEEDTCARCKANGTECVSRGRKKRKPAPTQDELEERSTSQDLQIQSLLRRLDETKTRSKLYDCLSQAQMEAAAFPGGRAGDTCPNMNCIIHNSSSTLGAPSDRRLQECSNHAGGHGVSSVNGLDQPAILRSGLFGPRDIVCLFDFYFDRLHASFAILDPALHTPQYLLSRSPLLFTMILAITTRHWPHRPKLHRLAMAYVCEAVVEALNDSYQSIETCQAFILLTVFPAPFQRWSENRSWLLIGASIRIAQQLRLDYPPPPDLPERERLNRIRTWFHIMTVDTSHCIQRGRTPTKPRNDFVYQMSDLWYRCSALNLTHDIYGMAYLDMMRLTSQLLDRIRPDKSNPDVWEEPDVLVLVREYDRKITERFSHWQQRIMEQCIFMDWAGPERDARLNLMMYLQRLVVLGAGVHWSLKKDVALAPDLLNSSVGIGQVILRTHVEQLYPSGYLRYAIEPQYLFVTYVAAFLLKLLGIRSDNLVDPSLRGSILDDVRSLVRVWSLADVALDKQHAPFIYSRFLSSLLEHHLEGTADDHGNGPPQAFPGLSWAQVPRSASPRGYDAGPSEYQTVFDADPMQFVEASHGGDNLSFQNFVTNIETAQAGWPLALSSEQLTPASFYEQSWQFTSWFEELPREEAASWYNPGAANTLYERTVLPG